MALHKTGSIGWLRHLLEAAETDGLISVERDNGGNWRGHAFTIAGRGTRGVLHLGSTDVVPVMVGLVLGARARGHSPLTLEPLLAAAYDQWPT